MSKGKKVIQQSLLEDRIERKFKEFHEKNPHVYKALVKLARHAKSKGKSKIGIGMIYEVLRWEYYLTTTDTDFKLNNNYRSRYARMIMENEPDLAGIFNLRELQ